MSNYGPPPFGAAYQTNASAPPAGYPFQNIPQYALQQQSSNNYAQPQGHPSTTFPAHHLNTYAHSANAQRTNPSAFTNGSNSSPFTSTGGGLSYSPHNPGNLPIPSSSSFGPSPFATLPPNHASISSPSPSPHNVIADEFQHRDSFNTPEEDKEKVREKPTASEDDLEDGELSSDAMSEVDTSVDRRLGPDITSQDAISQQRSGLSSYPQMTDREMAQNLVRELHTWGFSFQDIMAEVTDNDALRSIFMDLGLSIDIRSAASERAKPQPQADNLSTAEDRTIDDASHVRKDGNFDAFEKTQTGMGERSTAHSPNSVPQAKGVSASNDSKPLDRKALIAQKLAAKKAKPASSPGVAQMPQEAIAEGISPSNRAIPFQGSASSPAASTIPDQRITALNSSKPTTTLRELEDERRAHTELARQRIEALKQKAVAEQSKSTATSVTSKDAAPSTSIPTPQEAPKATPKLQVAETDIAAEAPSRKESYFSPVSQKPMFSIPGLFSAAAPTSSNGIGDLVVQTQNKEDTIAVAPESHQEMAAVTATQHPRPSTPPFPVNEPEGPVFAATQIRHEISDFLSSPPTKINRSLAQEDVGVIIDISDEESTRSDDGRSRTLADRQDEDDFMQSDNQVRSDERLHLRSLTPPGNFPFQKPSATMSTTTATPTVMSTPKGQEPRELRTKEMEIESMNRKIAELEANIKARKAKQAASRAQSPGCSGQGTASRATGTPLFDDAHAPAAPRVLSVSGDAESATSSSEQGSAPGAVHLDETPIENASNDDDSAPIKTRNSGSITDTAKQLSKSDFVESQGAEITELSESLEVSEQDETQHQLDPGTPSGNLPQQPTELLLEQQELAAQKEKLTAHQQSRRAEIESGLPVLDEEIERTRHKLQTLKEQEAELETEIQRGLEGRQMLLDELNRLSQVTAAIEYEQDVEPTQQEAVLAQSSHSTDGIHPSHTPGIRDDGLAQRGSAQATSASGVNGETDSHKISPPSDSSLTQVLPELNKSRPEDIPLGMQVDRLSEGELEEDVMDISRSDLDEGEVSENMDDQISDDYDDSDGAETQHQPTIVDTANECTQEVANTTYVQAPINSATGSANLMDGSTVEQDNSMEDAIDFDDEEMYEPPNDISVIDNTSPADSGALGVDMGEGQETAPTSPKPAPGEGLGSDLSESEINGSTASSQASEPAANDVEADKQIFNHMTNQNHQDVVVNGSDDDYEPPEPMSLNDSSVQALPLLVADNTVPTTSTSDADSYDQILAEHNTGGHFMPYESPLKQFKSYRYHPEYMSEVPSGFRSLTYSHAIRPETPICHYELSGTCNDPLCKAQHFSNMRISDDVILRELARSEGSSPDKQETFLAGLRELITDLRKRNIGSLTDIASAIIAYRKDFLADEFRVLPL